MIFNYSDLLELLFTEISNGTKNGLEIRVIDGFLKEPFESTVLDFSGHNLRDFEGETLKDLMNSKYRHSNELFDTIKKKTVSNLSMLIASVEHLISEGLSLTSVQDSFLSKPSVFSMFQIHDDYCFVCGRRTNYFMGDGVISKDAHVTEKHPLWNNLSAMEQKLYSLHFSERNSHTCSLPDGLDSYSYEIDIDDTTLVVSDNIISVFPKLYMESAKYISEKSGYSNDINSDLGVKYSQEFWNNKNVIYVQSGNTSPHLCVDKITGSIAAIDTDAWKSKKMYSFPIDISNMVKKMTVSTEVWAVQMMTLKEFKKVCKEQKKTLSLALNQAGAEKISVKPGRYKVTCYSAHRYSDRPVFFFMEQI